MPVQYKWVNITPKTILFTTQLHVLSLELTQNMTLIINILETIFMDWKLYE